MVMHPGVPPLEQELFIHRTLVFLGVRCARDGKIATSIRAVYHIL